MISPVRPSRPLEPGRPAFVCDRHEEGACSRLSAPTLQPMSESASEVPSCEPACSRPPDSKPRAGQRGSGFTSSLLRRLFPGMDVSGGAITTDQTPTAPAHTLCPARSDRGGGGAFGHFPPPRFGRSPVPGRKLERNGVLRIPFLADPPFKISFTSSRPSPLPSGHRCAGSQLVP